MRPNPDIVARGVALTLMRDIMPEVQTPFGQTNLGMALSLNLILAQEIDRLVDRLLVENRAVVAVLEAAAPVLPPGELRDRIGGARALLEPADYRVSTVLACNDGLRALLIEVHGAIEDLEGEAAAIIDERIWAELAESTRRRQIDPVR